MTEETGHTKTKHSMTNRVKWMILILCTSATFAAGQQSDDLRPALFNKDQGPETVQAMTAASKQGRQDLLLLALNNPHLANRQYAAERLCEMSGRNTPASLVTILQNDSLWVREINGGRNIGMQDYFVEVVRSALGSACHITATVDDLFDPTKRKNVVQTIQQKSR